MTKLTELRQALGLAADEHQRLADELTSLVNDETKFAAKKAEVIAAKSKVARLQDAVNEHTEALERSARLAMPALEEGRRAVLAQRRPLYSRLKAFKDYSDDKGVVIRAEEQAFRVGQFLLASIYGVEKSVDY